MWGADHGSVSSCDTSCAPRSTALPFPLAEDAKMGLVDSASEAFISLSLSIFLVYSSEAKSVGVAQDVGWEQTLESARTRRDKETRV